MKCGFLCCCAVVLSASGRASAIELPTVSIHRGPDTPSAIELPIQR